ncbi:MAG: hypothetical protein CML22_06660 [Rheinheimera sp.]|nr:hypothetical protein [Rheinheimera sp.]MBM33963.1 hypothetical protein [Rheinheimera sp.]|tara:strand:- start:74810 stop:75010 length:201 start_codon:yes stop_codon:yes gene_type:complete
MDKEIGYRTDAMLHQAKKSVDALFGEGYAEKHPELVAGFLVAASNNTMAVALEGVAVELVRKSKPS